MIVFHVCNRMVDALRKEMVRSKHLKLYDGFAPLAKEYILEKDWSASVGSKSSVEDQQSDNVELVNYLMEVTDLNNNQRKLIHDYFYQQKSIQEIAEDFNRDPKIIKKALRQVIGMLQQSVVTLSQEVNFI